MRVVEIPIDLPVLHADQVRAIRVPARFKALKCGRRWGKTTLAAAIISDQAGRGKEWGLKAFALPQALTTLGKEARALSVSAYYHKGEMKISQYAFDKVSRFKGVQKNHFISQFCGFRMGDHDPKRADDLADCGAYALAIGCGDGRGV